MSASPSLEDCKMLQELGFPQDRFPQMVWEYVVTDDDQWLVFCYETPPEHYVTSPPWLSGDPERPGILEWLEQEKGWRWQRSFDGKKPWLAKKGEAITVFILQAETLSELLHKIYEHETEA